MQWQRLGPGGGGAMYIPTIHPTDMQRAVVTCDMTGVYMTRNGGESWQQINFTGMARAFSFDPFKPTTLYTGSSGLYCSKDDGATWHVMYPPEDHLLREVNAGDHADHAFITKDGGSINYIEGLLVHPKAQGIIWAGVKLSPTVNYDRGGSLSLVASEDGGQTWRAPVALNARSVLRICPAQDDSSAILFTDDSILKAELTANGIALTVLMKADTQISDGAYGLNPDTGNWIYYYTQFPAEGDSDAHRSRVYRSDDLEKGWKEIGAGLFTDHVKGQRYLFTRVAVSTGDARKVYLSLNEPPQSQACAADEECFFGIFISEDFGESFHWALRIGNKQPENRTLGWVERDYTTGWAGAPFAIGICPTNPDVCYVTDWGACYRSIDGGKTWQQLYCTVKEDGAAKSTGLDITLVYNLQFDPKDSKHQAITCTDIGFFQSFDDGQTWRHMMKGIPEKWENTCYSMAFDPDVKGRAWSVWSNCHDLPRPKMYLNGQFKTRAGGVCRTEDGFENWAVTSNGLPEGIAPTSLLLDPKSKKDNRTLYITAMGDGVYRSRDDGQTWQNCSRGIEGNMNVWKLFRDKAGVLFVLVARGLEDGVETDGAMYKSTDGAESWEMIALPEKVNAPNYLAIHPEDSNCLYLACWPRVTDGAEGFGGLYKSADGGKNWNLLTADDSHVYGVAVDPANPVHVVWSNFENQVWESFDGGKTGKPMEGFTFKWPHQPIFHPEDPSRLYIATFGSGLWLGENK